MNNNSTNEIKWFSPNDIDILDPLLTQENYVECLPMKALYDLDHMSGRSLRACKK